MSKKRSKIADFHQILIGGLDVQKFTWSLVVPILALATVARAQNLEIVGKVSFCNNPENTAHKPYVSNSDGSNTVRIGGDAWQDSSSPVFSPDGTRVAYIITLGGKPGINFVDPNGANEFRVVLNIPVSGLVWLPDGSKISFLSSGDIYSMNTDGSGLSQLTATGDYGSFSWSPDGTKIAFGSNRNGNPEIYTANVDFSGPSRVTNNPASDSNPKWSPDGTKILFVSDRNGASEIFTMASDGSGQTLVPNTRNTSGSPAWSPDGKKILTVFPIGRIVNNVFTIWIDGSGRTAVTGNGNPGIGEPSVTVSSETDWQKVQYIGPAVVGTPRSRTITIQNTGSAVLNVGNITSSDAQFSVNPTNFPVAPGGTQNVVVTLTPISAGVKYTTLTISSNDLLAPSLKLVVNGGVAAGVPPPPPPPLPPPGTPADTTAPAAPTNPAATVAGGSNQISLTWNANGEPDLSYYIVYRNPASGFTPTSGDSVGRVNKPGTVFTTAALSNGTYYFRLSAVDSTGNKSVLSAQVSATISGSSVAPPPASPANLSATVSGTQVALVWVSNTEPKLAYYIVYRSGSSGFIPAPSDSIGRVDKPGTTFTNTGLTNGSTYFFRLSAVDSTGSKSSPSAQVSATIAPIVPPSGPPALTMQLPNTVSIPGSNTVRVDNQERIIKVVLNYSGATDSLRVYFEQGGVVRDVVKGSSYFDYTFLSAGTWVVHALVKVQGNPNLAEIRQEVLVTFFTKDVTPPTVPSGLSFQTGKNGVTLKWNANTEFDLSNYIVYRNTGGTITPKDSIGMAPKIKSSFTDSNFVAGSYSYGVAAVDTAGNRSGTTVISVKLAGAYRQSVSDLRFGNVIIGVSKTQTVTISNIGTATISVTLGIEGSDTTNFLSNPSKFQVPPMDSTTIIVRFTSASAGLKLAALRISHSDDNVAGAVFLQGTGVAGLRSDFNGDGVVNIDDFFLISDAMGKKVSSSPAVLSKFDLDGNGVVDLQDFFIFAGDYPAQK